MVGEGESGVGLVAILGVGIESPAGKHRDATFSKRANELGANGIGRGDQNVVGWQGAFEYGEEEGI